MAKQFEKCFHYKLHQYKFQKSQNTQKYFNLLRLFCSFLIWLSPRLVCIIYCNLFARRVQKYVVAYLYARCKNIFAFQMLVVATATAMAECGWGWVGVGVGVGAVVVGGCGLWVGVGECAALHMCVYVFCWVHVHTCISQGSKRNYSGGHKSCDTQTLTEFGPEVFQSRFIDESNTEL